ncbi:MAG: YwiC-like family protein [Actinobacteria bacterium]|nr:YwiC-like family protein [Actinomycetota bacterium]MCB8997981.1 YwiC-like family protein [Actinomycetota bacterium]MCB9414422.1 YwiC-like family protein [Actinomycetota bacterium]MCB9424707.1 YwiC-like family protein [Actinomycetota bacterium]HRY09390.1 YwiC-like family protein [Candidatus Nanopelagicales bacterium]
MTTGTTPTSRRIAIPNQHGAWAFLLVPLLLGFLVAGWSWVTGLFAVAWVLAYPASYYLGRAVVIRWRRGTWSRLAKRELRDGLPWILMAAVPAVALLVLRPWLLWVGAVLAGLWALSVWLTRTGHERGASNDLLLVAQAAVAVPLMWGIATNTANLGIADPAATDAWLAAFICLVFFTGSVLHVKSLIREADDRRWAIASRVFHVAALAMGLISVWLLLPFGVAAVRAFTVPAGSRPAVIGAVEIVVSVLVVVGAALALA